MVFSASNNITQICHRNVKTTNRLRLSLQSPFSFLSFCLIYCEWNCSITALLEMMSVSDSAVLGMKLVNDFSMYKKTENTFTFASTVVKEKLLEHRNMIAVENSSGGLLSVLDNLIITSSCSRIMIIMNHHHHLGEGAGGELQHHPTSSSYFLVLTYVLFV